MTQTFDTVDEYREFGYSTYPLTASVSIYEVIGDDLVPYLELDMGEIYDTMEALEAQAEEIVTALNCSKLPVD